MIEHFIDIDYTTETRLSSRKSSGGTQDKYLED